MHPPAWKPRLPRHADHWGRVVIATCKTCGDPFCDTCVEVRCPNSEGKCDDCATGCPDCTDDHTDRMEARA